MKTSQDHAAEELGGSSVSSQVMKAKNPRLARGRKPDRRRPAPGADRPRRRDPAYLVHSHSPYARTMLMSLVLLAAAYGAAVGLLVPRAVYRFAVPSGQGWRAACSEGHPIAGWVGLARCAGCAVAVVPAVPGAAVSEPPLRRWYGPRTAATVLVTALLCAVLASATGARPDLGVWLLITPVLVLLALVDIAVHRLPDILTLPLAAATLLSLGAAALAPGAAGSWTTALYGGLALGGTYFVLFLINPAGMGFGDVKLALTLGTALGWYGWDTVFFGGFAGLFLGALYGAGLLLLRGAGRKTAIPYGPFLSGGALAGVLLGSGLAA
jgi:leader peptidase (prepilin peptidase)/N-methyltransferase